MSIEKVLADNGITTLSFDEYKQALNSLGYDISPEYAKYWACVNSWDGEIYYSTSCYFKGTNIGFANVAIKSRPDLEYDNEGLIKFRMNHAFKLNGKVYIV